MTMVIADDIATAEREPMGARGDLTVTFLFEDLDVEGDVLPEVLEALLDTFYEHTNIRPAKIDMAVTNTRGGDDMGLTKHGEGSIIPENEQQKTAAQQGGQMSAEAAEALRKENEEADGARDLG